MANVEKLNNGNNNNHNNKEHDIQKILNPNIDDTAYGSNPNIKTVRSEMTEQRLKLFRENQKRIQQVIDSRERSVRDYKLELVEKKTDNNKDTNEYYIQKS